MTAIYRCPTCHRISAHPKDAEHRFCVVCGFEREEDILWVMHAIGADRTSAEQLIDRVLGPPSKAPATARRRGE